MREAILNRLLAKIDKALDKAFWFAPLGKWSQRVIAVAILAGAITVAIVFPKYGSRGRYP